MSYLALPIGIFLWYIITNKLGEKENYSISSRVLCGVVCLIILIATYTVQEYRRENFNFWLGILPSFLAALGFPFAIVVLGENIKTKFENKFISWTLITFSCLTIYEIVLWLDGRNFDIIDILFTLIGALISGLIISKLIPKMIIHEIQ